MAEIPRLNGVIATLEAGRPAFTHVYDRPTWESAIALSQTDYDGVVFEMEHAPYDIRALRDACSTCSTAASS